MRRFVRDHKDRRLVDKRMTEHDAVSRFVDRRRLRQLRLQRLAPRPSSLMREIIRQRKRDLWIAAKFTAHDATLLTAGGCVSSIDVGWMEVGRVINEAMNAGRVKLFEWTNGALAYRHLAGALGVPFLPLRYLGGTDVFRGSGAKLIEDPYTGQAVCLVPALNPDVALIHVNQCDEFGNARIFGPGLAPVETAMASKRVILSTEEIIDSEEIRQHPQHDDTPVLPRRCRRARAVRLLSGHGARTVPRRRAAPDGVRRGAGAGHDGRVPGEVGLQRRVAHGDAREARRPGEAEPAARRGDAHRGVLRMSAARAFTTWSRSSTPRAMMEEEKLYFVAIGGPPLLAMLLAKQLHAPKIAYVVEDGTIAPEMPVPAPPFLIGRAWRRSRAVAWTDMNTVDFHAALGYIDYGVLAAVQVDEYGNFNSTFLGDDYDRPARRFGGPGGANEIASLCWRTILMTRLERRKFVRNSTSCRRPASWTASPGARERAGLPAETGP